MEIYLKPAAAALITAILVLTVKKQNEAVASAVAAAGCCICGLFLCDAAQPVAEFFRQTADVAGIGNNLLSPLLKTVGIGLLTQLSADICTDAGQTALAKTAQTCGTVLCLCLSLPLFQAVLALVREMTGI